MSHPSQSVPPPTRTGRQSIRSFRLFGRWPFRTKYGLIMQNIAARKPIAVAAIKRKTKRKAFILKQATFHIG